MAFKLKKYSYKALRQLSVQDRISAAQDREVGQWLLSLLTPSQFVDLFPRYYRERLPDISGFLKAMPTTMSASRQKAIEEKLNNTTTGAAAGSNYKAGGWKERYQKDIDEQRRASVSRRDQTPTPELSPEQRKVFEDLKSNPLAADDPRAKMLTNLSENQLKATGIEKYKEGDKEFFRRTTKTFSEEETKAYIQREASYGGGTVAKDLPVAARKLLDAISIPEGAGKYNTLFGGDKVAGVITDFSHHPGINPRTGKSDSGRYQFLKSTWNDVVPRFNKKNPNDPITDFSPRSQDRAAWFLAQERYKRNAGRDLLSDLQSGNFNEGALGGTWISIGKDPNWKSKYYNPQLSKQTDPITTDYSDKSMQLAREKLARQLERKQMTSLAEFTSAQLPAPGSSEAAQIVGDSTNAQAVADRIKKEFGHLKNPQCVALAKAYVGATGSVTEWRRGTNVMDGTLKPGTPIATFMDRAGNPSSRYDAGGIGKSGAHTTHAAVFLDYVRVGGKITGIRVMEQYSTSGGAKEKVYPIGGFGTNNGANYYSINNAQGEPLGQHNPMLQVNPAQAPPAAQVVNTTTKPPTPVAGPHGDNTPQVRTPAVVEGPGKKTETKTGDQSKSAEKKVEGKVEFAPNEVKPVEKKTEPSPAKPPESVRTPAVVEGPGKKEATPAPTTVKTNAMGGVNKINTEEISAYPIGGLKGDNAVVVNKHEKPLFTMNTNETMTINPKSDTATVAPNSKERNVGAAQQQNPVSEMMSEFTRSIQELSDRFDNNKPVHQIPERPDPFPAEGGVWLNNLNNLTEHPFHSPSARRAFYRSHGQGIDNGTGTNHFSHGNNS